MSKKYNTEDSLKLQIASEPTVAYSVTPETLHLDITLEHNAIISDIKKALSMIKGIASVKLTHKKDNTIPPALARKIAKARKDYAEGRYTECKTKEELNAFLDSL